MPGTPSQSQEISPYLQIAIDVAITIWNVLVALAIYLREATVALVYNFAPLGLFKGKDVSGQTVLITGAAGGLGRALALRFSTVGCRLVLWDRDEKGLKETAALCDRAGSTNKLHIHVVDMCKRENIAEAADKVRKEVGHVHILINNAGVGIGGKVLEIDEQAIITTMEVNCMSHFWMARAFLPEMIENGDGHVVSIASFGGFYVAAQDQVPYCTSKFAAVAIQQGLENELACIGKDFIKFTTICPFYFQSQLMNNLTTNPGYHVMTVDEVADWTVNGILNERALVIIPREYYLRYAIRGLLPRSTIKRLTVTNFMNTR